MLLDEATASLDVENETKVQQALSRLLAGKTVPVSYTHLAASGEPLIVNEAPDDDGLAQCRALGAALAGA